MTSTTIRFTSFLILLVVFIQPSFSQTTFGIRVGINRTNVHFENESGETGNTKALSNVQFGLTADISLGSSLSVQPGINFTGRGFQQDGGWIAEQGNNFKVRSTYIDVPVHLIYKPSLTNGKIALGAGPYMGYGIGGKWKTKNQVVIGDIVLSETEGKVIFKNDVSDGEFGHYLYGKPLDYGASVFIAYEFWNKLYVQVSAQQSIHNLYPNDGGIKPNATVRNRGYGISLGYRFN